MFRAGPAGTRLFVKVRFAPYGNMKIWRVGLESALCFARIFWQARLLFSCQGEVGSLHSRMSLKVFLREVHDPMNETFSGTFTEMRGSRDMASRIAHFAHRVQWLAALPWRSQQGFSMSHISRLAYLRKSSRWGFGHGAMNFTLTYFQRNPSVQ